MATRKKKVKIFKEFVNTQFKEIKKPKPDSASDSPEEPEEDKSDNNVSGSDFDATPTRRIAPVLQSENTPQNLESVAETAPTARRTDTDENPGNQNFYTANYSARYNNANYETRREEEPTIRPVARPSGVLNDMRNANSELRRIQQTWQNQPFPEMAQSQGARDDNLSEKRIYRPAEDTLKEQTNQIAKRRRMF